jgi:hypothetical protein
MHRSHNWGAVLTRLQSNGLVDCPCIQVYQTVELVEEGACLFAVIAGQLARSERWWMEKGGVRRGQPVLIVFDGIGSKYYQGHRPQAREDRVSNPRLTGLCSFDFDWRKRLVAHLLLKRLVAHLLLTLQSSWLKKTKGMWTCCLPQGGHCTTIEESQGDSELQMFSLYRLMLLMTDRKKSRLVSLCPVSSCVRVILCLPGPRLVFDQISCWVIRNSLVAINRCGVEPSIDRLKKPNSGPTAP